MNTPLQTWLKAQLEGPHAEKSLQNLLGSVWKILWNSRFPLCDPANSPEEALLLARDWAESVPEFPPEWRTWLVEATQAPLNLLPAAHAIVSFCEDRETALAQLRLFPDPVAHSGQEVLRDYRSVPCPLNSMRARLALSRLANGQWLRLYLDCGSPIENVPGALLADGHRILEKRRFGDYWELLVEKASI